MLHVYMCVGILRNRNDKDYKRLAAEHDTVYENEGRAKFIICKTEQHKISNKL